MSETAQLPPSGFGLERVFFAEESFRLVRPNPEMPEFEAPITFGWDWRVSGARNFEVLLQLRVGPTRARPEEANLVICGAFSVLGEQRPVTVLDFVKAQGPAILFPYLREGLASLTGRGPHGPHMLAPVNVFALMQKVDTEKSTGALQLKSGGEPAFLSA